MTWVHEIFVEESSGENEGRGWSENAVEREVFLLSANSLIYIISHGLLRDFEICRVGPWHPVALQGILVICFSLLHRHLACLLGHTQISLFSFIQLGQHFPNLEFVCLEHA